MGQLKTTSLAPCILSFFHTVNNFFDTANVQQCSTGDMVADISLQICAVLFNSQYRVNQRPKGSMPIHAEAGPAWDKGYGSKMPSLGADGLVHK